MHLQRFSNNGIRAKGWPAMAWLSTRGDQLRLGPLQGAAIRKHDRLRPARKGLSPADIPTASRGGGAGRRGGRRLVGRLSAAKGSRRLCRGSDDGGAVRVKEG
ncbi:hypothetical protein B296_00030678 [Ensete ventricosum]|uniref:Uncharacterized protein n=1 Tax=Ensete ventricosum TaxID=4639 RepID=A0A426XDX4_ENSVE|nr:hypothetical protein B296_00030678 [Ensete ventricosum]